MIFDPKNIVTFPDDCDFEGLMAAIREAGHDVENNGGKNYSTDGVAVQAIIDAYDHKAGLIEVRKREVAAKWYEETKRIHTTDQGIQVALDDASVTKLTAAYIRAKEEPSATFDFIDKSGQWRALSADELVAVYKSVSAVMQEQFSKRKSVEAQLESAVDFKAVAAVDISAGWPT